ncbi:carbohydrate binding domain-containing protein [Streptomyces sp. NPDC008141]|uniref:carbohydrate binding domain-containing protein n=1 Tax=Streptomyces sp. NPDC008141 TaxID=3364815 RepID=UPI0036EB5935
MTRLAVLAGFGSTLGTPAGSIAWTDISQWVDIQQAGITVTRGAQDEQAESQTGTATLTLDNSDGRFTSGLATSPYFPNVRKNVPIWVRLVITAKNLMPNPSFEDGVTAWTGSGTPTRAASATHVHTGSQAMLITWGATVPQTVTSPVFYGLEVGQRYTYSTYVWVPTGDCTVQVTVAGGAAGSISSLYDQWQRLTVSWTATTTSYQVRVRNSGTPAAGDQVWVDAGQVEEGSSATAFDADGPQYHGRLWGMVNNWPTQWNGMESKVVITCSDRFKMLGKSPLRTMLTEEVLLDDPLGYYPLSEPSESTSAGDLSGTTAGPLTISAVGSGGDAAFASGEDAGPDGLGALTLSAVNASNGKYLAADLGSDYEEATRGAYVFAECWFKTSIAGRVFFGLTSVDNRFQLVFSLDATGKMTIETTRTGEALVPATVLSPNLANGQWHQFVYDEFLGNIWVDGVSYPVLVDVVAGLRLLTVGAFTNSRLYNGSLAHLALYAPDPGDVAQYVGHYATGTTLHIGEDADDRAARIASYVGATVTAQGVTFGGMASQAALGSAPLQHLQDVARTESAKLFADRESSAIVLQSRDVRYNPTTAVTLTHADLETDDVRFDDDDQKLVNVFVGSRPGGATQRIVDQASRDAYGTYEQSETLLKETDHEVVAAGQWVVNRFADPPAEMRQLPVEAYTLPLATYRALLGAEISTVIDVTGLPDEANAAAVTVTVEGYTETIRYRQHHINFHTSRADTAAVWVLNDPVYSVLGTTTRLAY